MSEANSSCNSCHAGCGANGASRVGSGPRVVTSEGCGGGVRGDEVEEVQVEGVNCETLQLLPDEPSTADLEPQLVAELARRHERHMVTHAAAHVGAHV